MLAGTSRVTMLPAPIKAFSPIVMLARMVAPEPMEAPCFTSVGSTFSEQLTITNGYGDFFLSAIPLNAGTAHVKGVELASEGERAIGLGARLNGLLMMVEPR